MSQAPAPAHPLVRRIVESCADEVAWPMGPRTDLEGLCALLWGHQMHSDSAANTEALASANHTVLELAYEVVDLLRRHLTPRAASILCAQISCQLAREQNLDPDAQRLLLRHLAVDLGAGDLAPTTMRRLLREFSGPSPEWESDE